MKAEENMDMFNYKYDEKMESRKWAKEIPYLNFPNDWEVKIIPPFRGAVVRFWIKKGDVEISVYLDCYDTLGYVGEPYWEVYPHNGDVFRCLLNETKELIQAISESIKEQEMI